MSGFMSRCCCARINSRDTKCPSCGDKLNKPRRCPDRMVIDLLISNPLMEMSAQIRDARQCRRDEEHKGKHKCSIAAERNGKPISVELSW